MSRPNWRSRSVLAAGAAAILVGTGVAALASTGSEPIDDAPSAAVSQDTGQGGLDDVRRSLEDLMAQADALEASLATTPAPAAPAGSDGQAVGGPQEYLDDDHGDGDDDRGDDDHGDDDRGAEDEGDDD